MTFCASESSQGQKESPVSGSWRQCLPLRLSIPRLSMTVRPRRWPPRSARGALETMPPAPPASGMSSHTLTSSHRTPCFSSAWGSRHTGRCAHHGPMCLGVDEPLGCFSRAGALSGLLDTLSPPTVRPLGLRQDMYPLSHWLCGGSLESDGMTRPSFLNEPPESQSSPAPETPRLAPAT